MDSMETSPYNSAASEPMMTLSTLSPHLLTVAESAVTNFLHNSYDGKDMCDMETGNLLDNDMGNRYPRESPSEHTMQPNSGTPSIKSEVIEPPVYSIPGIANFSDRETVPNPNQPIQILSSQLVKNNHVSSLTANEVPIFPGEKHEFTPERLFKGVIYLAAERRYTRTRGVKLDIAARTYLSRLTGLYLRLNNYQLDANGEEFIKYFMSKTVLIGQPDGLTANQKQELFIILRDAYRNRRRTILRKERMAEAQSPSFLEKKAKLQQSAALNSTRNEINGLLDSIKASTDESEQAFTNDLLSAITFLNGSQSETNTSMPSLQFSQSGSSMCANTNVEDTSNNNIQSVGPNDSSSSHEKSGTENSPIKLQVHTNLIEDYAKTVKSSHELLMKVTSALTDSHEKLLVAQQLLLNSQPPTQPVTPDKQTLSENSIPKLNETSCNYDEVDVDVYSFRLGMIVDFLVSQPEPSTAPMYLIGTLTGILPDNVQVKILEWDDRKFSDPMWISVASIRKCFLYKDKHCVDKRHSVPMEVQTVCLQSRPYEGD